MINISVVQFTPTWADLAANREMIRSLLKNIRADIIVLPELCTTGYSFLSREEAIRLGAAPDGKSIKFFSDMAEATQAVIVAGFAERSGDKVYNSALAALPGGENRIYRKTHLFFREKYCFDPGNSGFFVINHPLLDCRIGIMICNDWRYPEAARSLALLGADVIVCPCNLVSEVWKIGMPARALENKVYLTVANRCGTEIRTLEDGGKQVLTFNGCSAIYDYNGQPLARAESTGDSVLSVMIDPIATRDKAFNPWNDLLADRRPEYYI